MEAYGELDVNNISKKVNSPKFGEAAKLTLEVKKENPAFTSVDFWWVDDLVDHIEFGAHSKTEREYMRLSALGEQVTDDRTMKVYWKCGLITTVMSGVDSDRLHPPMVAELYNGYIERKQEKEAESA